MRQQEQPIEFGAKQIEEDDVILSNLFKKWIDLVVLKLKDRLAFD